MKKENPTMLASLSGLKKTLKIWWWTARPKTLIASLSPVLIAATLVPQISWIFFSLCLFFSLLIQIGANFANDYFDFFHKADGPGRVGPSRAIQSGWLTLRQLKRGIVLVFMLAFLVSLPLLMRGGFWGFSIVAFSILFAIWYTAGSSPLGYLGLGEPLVFLFYGPIAVMCSYYVLTLEMNFLVFYASLPPGFLACSVLIANNLRDEISDRAVNKKTLVVRFGKKFGQFEYGTSIVLAGLIPLSLALMDVAPFQWSFLALILPAAYPSIHRAFMAKSPEELVPLLPSSAKLLALYTLLFVVACGGIQN